MTIWYAIAMIIKRNDIADIAWGFGFIVLAFFAAYSQNIPSIRMIFLVIMMSPKIKTDVYEY